MGQSEILLYIAGQMVKYRIPYLLSGSLASSYYGYPRATHDIDIIIEIPEDKKNNLLEMANNLEKSYLVDIKEIKDAISNLSQFNIIQEDSGIKIDFWLVGNDEFEQNKFKRKKEYLFHKQKISLISPEDLILTKLVWCKEIRSERHLRDCIGIIKVQEGRLDLKYLTSWADKLGVAKLLHEVMKSDY